MKKILLIVAMLSIMLFSYGTANAMLGVVDDVPGTDVVFPIICEKGGTMNTLYAVAEVWDWAATADLVVYDRSSVWVYDDWVEWTESDVLVGDCQSLIAGMSPIQKAALEVSIGGRTYYVGYLVFYNWNFPGYDQFISWVYLVDLMKGFASGFNGYQAEGMLTGGLCEYDLLGGFTVCQSAVALFPRYLLMNNKTETWNWWILIYGDNDSNRYLAGWICNEEEYCISLNIPVPKELNIIDVEPYIPLVLHAGYPKAGFGWFLNAEADYDNTVYGFSYQRAEGTSVAGTWDVIHPIHGWYFDTWW